MPDAPGMHQSVWKSSNACLIAMVPLFRIQGEGARARGSLDAMTGGEARYGSYLAR